MKILIGDKDNVDFGYPIIMNSGQKKRFIDFLKTIFAVVEEEETDVLRTSRLGSKFFSRSWSTEEYQYLLELKDTDKLSELLGRSWISVDIKRGDFIPDFMSWASETKKDLLKGDLKKMIEEFMKEKRNELINRKKKRKENNLKLKEMERLEEELISLDSGKKKDQIDLAIRLNLIKEIGLDEYLLKRKEEILKKIKRLKEEVDFK